MCTELNEKADKLSKEAFSFQERLLIVAESEEERSATEEVIHLF